MDVKGWRQYKIGKLPFECNGKEYTAVNIVVRITVRGETEYYDGGDRWTPIDYEIDDDSILIDKVEIEDSGVLLDSNGVVVEDDFVYDEICESDCLDEAIMNYDFPYDELEDEDIRPSR